MTCTARRHPVRDLGHLADTLGPLAGLDHQTALDAAYRIRRRGAARYLSEKLRVYTPTRSRATRPPESPGIHGAKSVALMELDDDLRPTLFGVCDRAKARQLATPHDHQAVNPLLYLGYARA